MPLLIILASLFPRNAAFAADEADMPAHVEAQLWREKNWIEPGRPLAVAVRLIPKDGWHTYWRNPGDSGMATRLRWTLPPGFEAGPVAWPRPERIVLPKVVDYGYRRPHALLVELKTPPSIQDESVAIGVKVQWLECLEACVPHSAELSVRVPVKAAPSKSTSAQRALFEEARRELPIRLGARASRVGGRIELRLEPAPEGGKAEFFPYDNDAVENEDRQASIREGGALVVRLKPAAAASGGRLAGVLALEKGPAVEIDVPIQESEGESNEKK